MRHKISAWWKAVWMYPQERISIEQPAHDAYWAARGRTRPELSPWQKERTDIFLRYIDTPNTQTISDVGCGDGAVLQYIQEKVPQVNGIGVDGAPGALAHVAEAGFETVRADVADTSVVLPEADYTILFEIIEHVPHAEVLVDRARKVSRKGVCISVPNTGFFTYRLRLLFGKTPAQWIQHPGEHVRFWTYADMKWWLRAQGIDAHIHTYQGVPVLRSILPGLFAAGMVVYIPCASE